MQNECLICGKQIKYIQEEREMECSLCHKKLMTKTFCVKGHYVCDDCHTNNLDNITNICMNTDSSNPIDILNKLMDEEFCHIHGPEHHILVGASLLTAYKNAGGDINLEKSLIELINRAKSVPGGTCGFWGACGAGISTGMFVSIISNSTPLTKKGFKLSNKMTSKSLNTIADIGGPRCCKRDSYLSILSAISFIDKQYDVVMQRSQITCKYSKYNNECIKDRCPFYQKG